ncbi:proline-, glutamic acid- and leucine-rich protein 1-like isoform X1 [Chenopodium quinoa]|uniref:proline-, glutamic acid- and leucine-rich protein 1-like isoform X1 n=3 Tax=Chenopodium quinoa TaxID=63459 RepID=UPI000B78F520|nr:proline-, glutamic acid- and leucine-rich protein 1-like isoform X1 [Chenopodium quinoa]
MAAFDHSKDLNDVALKPRLLRILLKDQLPDETRPLRNPSEISTIISTLKIHSLLSEDIPPSAHQKHVSDWSSAVDAWVRRILILCRSDLPDKCWAGVCLLGVTSMECSSARFLKSHSDWFNVLLSHVQPSSGASQFVKVSSCAAVSDLLTRLGRFSNLKKDGNSYAGKLVQPILKMLSEDVTEAVSDVAAHLLLTILNYFPPSVHRHHDNAEEIIVSKIMSANCNANVLKKLSCCLASLPKSKGDEDSWSLMMQKVLLSLSALLNNSLEGLEEERRRVEAVTLLVPPGKDPPPTLGGKMMTGEAFNTGERSQKMLISSVTSLMQCCCMMLTNSYPVQVTVPICPLLAIIRRVLMVNGSLPEALQPFTTAMQQEFVCLQLPVLHLNMLEVLAAVIKGLRSQLLPHAADIIWLLMKYLKTCCMPELRTKVYSIIRALLVSMGAGMALYISEEVIDNIFNDLKFADTIDDVGSLDEQSHVKVSQPLQKKRKHGALTGPLVEQQPLLCSEPKNRQASIALKKAALETLEALVVMGGALSCDSWRRRIDDLMIEVATNACKGGWTHDEKPFYCKETRAVWEDFQLVALHALLASILSPAGYRPPYLSKGLEIFHKGKQNSGTKVAEFCSQALVALEVLIHPRALPLIDVPLSNGSSYSFGRTDFGVPTDKQPQNFLYEMYKEENLESGVPARGVHKDMQFDENSLDVTRYQNHEESNVVIGLPDNVMPMERDDGSKPANLASKVKFSFDRKMVDVQHREESNKSSLASICDNNPVTITSTTEVEYVVAAAPDNKLKMPMIEMPMIEKDDDLSDSFPDIIDADPDSDSDYE